MAGASGGLNDAQRDAIAQCMSILGSAGLDSFIPRLCDSVSSVTPCPSSSASCAAVSRYHPPLATLFTDAQKALREHIVTRETRGTHYVHHPLHALVEYPQSSSVAGETILHFFLLDPDKFYSPAESFQYSFNESHGQKISTTPLLCNDQGVPVQCLRRSGRCSSVKTCSFSPTALAKDSIPFSPSFNDADKELFLKTFAFYCALIERGCNFIPATDDASDDLSDNPIAHSDLEALGYDPVNDGRVPVRHKCKGRLILFVRDNLRFIRCSYHGSGTRGHLFLSGIDNYDTEYLQDLLDNNMNTVLAREKLAASRGFGPLAACHYITSVRSQSQCSDFHRLEDGTLQRGRLIVAQSCEAKCTLYVPIEDQRAVCPRALAVCTGVHSHADPAPTRTPQPIRDVLDSMLLDLDWQLADATPRRLMLNGTFMGRMQTVLGWTDKRLPTLSHLHPSLGNYDHVAYLINCLRKQEYPDGTGFKAAYGLLARNRDVSPSLHYVRTILDEDVGGADFRAVICMFPTQSSALLTAKRITIDTAFKRVRGWYEFEIEAWDDSCCASATVARVFLNSLTREAHFLIFRALSDVVKRDCDTHLKFSYLHGEGAGWDSVHADQHKGQAMGLGDFAAWLAVSTLPPQNPYASLTPLVHLSHFYMLCVTHFRRNLLKIKNKVAPEIYSAMLSLSSSEPLQDFDATISLIRSGPKAANDWLSDKLVGSPFALPALYRPKSLIPASIWKAAPRTTNGNEQAHRSINRDGTQLSLLAGIERGLQHDWRLLSSRTNLNENGVYTRYQVPDHFRRAIRSLRRHELSRKRTLTRHDDELSSAVASVTRSAQNLAKIGPVTSSSISSPTATKRVDRAFEDLAIAEEHVRKLSRGASGRVQVPFQTAGRTSALVPIQARHMPSQTMYANQIQLQGYGNPLQDCASASTFVPSPYTPGLPAGHYDLSQHRAFLTGLPELHSSYNPPSDYTISYYSDHRMFQNSTSSHTPMSDGYFDTYISARHPAHLQPHAQPPSTSRDAFYDYYYAPR